MNRRELCDELAQQSGVPVADVDRVVTALTYVVPTAVKKGDRVALVGFGTWERQERRARKARNPRTGQTVKVKATKIPRFRPGTPFKQAVAGGRITKPAVLAQASRRTRPTTRAVSRSSGPSGTARRATQPRASSTGRAATNSSGRRRSSR